MHDSYNVSAIVGEASIIPFDRISPSENQVYFTLESILVWDVVLLHFSVIGLIWLRNETNQCWQVLQPLPVFS